MTIANTIWVYEYHCPSDYDMNVALFESERDARKYACDRIKRTMAVRYGADDSDSDHHDVYIKILDHIKNGDYEDAIIEYADWVDELEDEAVFHAVYSRDIHPSSEGGGVAKSPSKSSSMNGKSKKVYFTNGATCKCGYHNEYASESNQDDGTYLCGTCKALGGVFGS